ncbi:hypothetical protein ABI59_11670 [Acidobacteria bacterium Mor1]|nr:hypothetical protein ABI59_11670 [Acidobacteria bacterium Mor1]
MPTQAASIDLQAVRAAADRIRPYIVRTPVLRSARIDESLGAELFFKCENLQRVGAFKARGATNAVLSLDSRGSANGVIAHSSGNHAAALAYAAGIRGIACTIVMPESASPVKIAAVRRRRAEIVFCAQAERESTTQKLIEERGATLIHPFEHPDVIAGQGTAALELLEQAPDLDAVVTPVGGGGLFAGTSITVKTMRPEMEILGAEPEAVDDAYRSFATGVRQPAVRDPQTACDGLLTGIGEINFEILRARDAQVLTAGEDAILDAGVELMRTLRIVPEPSAAVALAAIRAQAERFRGKRVGVVLTGGNSDFAWLTGHLPLAE